MFLLDTDHIGIIQRQTEPEASRLLHRMRGFALTDFYVSIVSFHEQTLGWNAYINRAQTATSLVRAYRMYQQILTDFSKMQVVAFDESALDQYEMLRRQKIRVGTMDLRIAATALSRGFTVLSRNVNDFQKVPGLALEDWSAEIP